MSLAHMDLHMDGSEVLLIAADMQLVNEGCSPGPSPSASA